MRSVRLILPGTLLGAGSVQAADLGLTKTYLTTRLTALKASTARLVAASDTYHHLAQGVGFDYARLWKTRPVETKAAVLAARAAWRDASPRYEQIEGFFAGQEPFTRLDVITDAANPGSGADGIDHDVTLPSGKVLRRPGALFNLTEATLWGLNPTYTALNVNLGAADGLGNALPDADVLLGGARALDGTIGQLRSAARPWQPTPAYVFNTLTANVPTTRDFLEVWRNSRFVSGATSDVPEFAAISRLNDLRDNISSWQVIYGGISPDVKRKSAALDAQVRAGLTDLHTYEAAGLPTGVADKARRFRLLTDAYGVEPDIGIVRAGNARMQGLLDHVRQLVAEGSAWEVEMEKRGTVDELARTIAWVEEHAAALVGS